jgi:hypothetical protein
MDGISKRCHKQGVAVRGGVSKGLQQQRAATAQEWGAAQGLSAAARGGSSKQGIASEWMASAQGWHQQGTRQARDGMSTKVASSHGR